MFRFLDNCILIGCVRHSLLLTEYLSLGVNVLTNSLKISITTKTEFLELIYCAEDSSSLSDTLTC